MIRRSLSVTATLTAAAALLLTACGGSPQKSDKIAGAEDDGNQRTSPSSSPSDAAKVKVPEIKLPKDLIYHFDWGTHSDKAEIAVLRDGQQFILATDLAIANQDPLDKAYRFYSEGEAAANTQADVQEFVDHKARTTGTYRFYHERISLRKDGTAELSYCEDQSKAYNKFLTTGTVDTTPTSKNSYVIYDSNLTKNKQGVWVTTKMVSQRGATQCQP